MTRGENNDHITFTRDDLESIVRVETKIDGLTEIFTTKIDELRKGLDDKADSTSNLVQQMDVKVDGVCDKVNSHSNWIKIFRWLFATVLIALLYSIVFNNGL